MANNLADIGKIRVAAVDFDGVITDLDINWPAAIHQASEIAGYDIKSLLTFYEKNFGTPIFQKISAEMEKIEFKAAEKAEVLPLAKEALQKLMEKHVDAYVVSMQTCRVVEGFLERHGLAGYFKGLVTREVCPSKKAQVQYVMAKTGCSPEQVLLIDDSRRNLALCSDLGVACLLFEKGSRHFLGRRDMAKEGWGKVLELLG